MLHVCTVHEWRGLTAGRPARGVGRGSDITDSTRYRPLVEVIEVESNPILVFQSVCTVYHMISLDWATATPPRLPASHHQCS